ncbi:MAG: TIGR03936 family radical SAM-associated protein [Gemmataceae bacterium]
MTSVATPSDANRRRYRLRFRKAEDLRLVSHHDLMHCVERLLRRAELPIAYSQGFHPQPKFAFALSLALGVMGSHEVLELELTENLPAEDVLARMQRHAPPGLTFLSIRTIEGKSSLLVRRAFYRLAATQGGARTECHATPETDSAKISPENEIAANDAARAPLRVAANQLPDAIAAFLAQTEAWVIRERPNRRRLNVRPFVESLTYADGILTAALWITPNGAARPEEVFSHLGLTPLLEDGAVIERSDLELLDELPEAERTMPAIVGAVSEEIPGDDRGNASRKTDPASAQPTPLLSNPLSFDT